MTYRPISLITRDCLMRTEIKLPKALRVIEKLRPRAAVVPKTAEKKRLAVNWSLAAMSALGTAYQPHPKHILTGCEIRDIAQYVQYSDEAQAEKSRSLDGPNGILDFAHDIEGVLVPLVREGDVDEGVG